MGIAILYLSDLLTYISNNDYQLPSVQREFVWSDDRIRDLIMSVYSGYPLGSIVLWNPRGMEIQTVPFTDSREHKEPTSLVIDGQQRLTALLLMKNQWKIRRDAREIVRNPVYLNMRTGRFRVSAKDLGDSDYIDVSHILDDTKYESILLGQTDEGFKSHLRRMKSSFQKIQFPVYTLTPELSYKDVAKIFLKINSAGVKIGDLDMFLSLLASNMDLDFKKTILDFHHRKYESFGLDLKLVIRSFIALSGEKQSSIRRKTLEGVIENLSKNKIQLRKNWETTAKSIEELLRYLSDLGIDNSKYLPSQSALLPMVYNLFRKNYKVPEIGKNEMFLWFVLASFFGRYSGSPSAKLDEDIETISENSGRSFLELIKNIQKRGRVRIEENDLRAPVKGSDRNRYLLLLSILLHKNQAPDWFGATMINTKERPFTTYSPKTF
jgi:hypothetical protein